MAQLLQTASCLCASKWPLRLISPLLNAISVVLSPRSNPIERHGSRWAACLGRTRGLLGWADGRSGATRAASRAGLYVRRNPNLVTRLTRSIFDPQPTQPKATEVTPGRTVGDLLGDHPAMKNHPGGHRRGSA